MPCGIGCSARKRKTNPLKAAAGKNAAAFLCFSCEKSARKGYILWREKIFSKNRKKSQKTLAFFCVLRYDSRARVRKGRKMPFSDAQDCTICDDAGGCGLKTAGFSAEYVRFQTGRKNTVCSGWQRGFFCLPNGRRWPILATFAGLCSRTLCRPGVRRLANRRFFHGEGGNTRLCVKVLASPANSNY